MGGEGSGRKPSVETIIKQSQPTLTPLGDGLFLPNYSGVQDVALKTHAPLSVGGGGTKSISIAITNPTGSDNFLIYRFPEAVTIEAIHAVVMNGTNVQFKINECDGNGVNAAQICNTVTATTTNTAGVITNADVDAGDYISYTSTANTGGVTKLIIAIDYS